MNTKRKGDITELKAQLALLEKNISVLLPIGDNEKYDLVFDYNNHLYKVQVRTSQYRNGCITFSTRNSYYLKDRCIRTQITQKDVDFFLTIGPQDNIYIVPIEECARGCTTLRVETPKSNGGTPPKWADEYLLDNQLQKL